MTLPDMKQAQPRALYPAELHQRQPSSATVVGSSDTTDDERLARELQAQFDREQPVMARAMQPAELPYNCGNCATTHLVRNAAHESQFQCTRCGRLNRIVMQQQRPVVVVESASWVPIPIFCSIQ